ncbi:MAG: 3-mercaptopyruvate sulfurtransferase [Thermoflexibacter sp.]|jgi:thiosulfate/3-mercaptopyruvate sulfurtransferase|nr:3-mercaptopyruvate sulfurtransferase [Thermoflexibacter sp.]
MTNVSFPSVPIVDVAWLATYFDHPNLVILDASMPKVGATSEENPYAHLKIKKARFFDIERVFSDTNSPLPHTVPTPEAFTQSARQLGINHDSIIIVYDNIGIYSAPRAWWLFRVMGHKKVFVLDGGLPAWKEAGKECQEIGTVTQIEQGNFTASYQTNLIKNADEVLVASQDKQQVIIDARAEARFLGKVDEPRQGLRKGHIPNSKNIPFTKVQKNNHFLDQLALQHLFEEIANKDQTLIFSCGSGVTACVVALGAEIAGYTNLSVYDGSWSEWGLPSDLPLEI